MSDEQDDFWPGLIQAIRQRLPEGTPYLLMVMPPVLDPEEQVQMVYRGMDKKTATWALRHAAAVIEADVPFERIKIE